ncbi:hypothetical protein VE02_01309 [Pseudogymnoascus sp. 03VT05]|nr:hypothetical protein VE02_01309 [Pseudogymnoascus sp. 03VT05]
MSQSPSKRRKLSPEVGAPPSTPSRIPGPRGTERATTPVRNTPGIGLSASPSKRGAGVSRPAAQVVEGDVGSRTTEGAEVPGIIGQAAQTAEVEATTPRRTRRTPGGGMTSAPRRRSQSPQKQDPKPSTSTAMTDEQNPFQKKGLRRSPIPTTGPAGGTDEQNSFQKKGGLRRSPIPSAGAAEVVPQTDETQEAPVVARPTTPTPQSTTPLSNPPARVVTTEGMDPFKKGGLRRSDIASPEPAAPSVPTEPTEPTDPFKKSGLRRSDIASPAPAAPAAPTATVAPVAPVATTEPTDPFKKGGLRRSDIASPAPTAPVAPPTESTESTNPFKKSGLRRSDVASPIHLGRADNTPAAPTEPTEPTNPFKKSGLRRSDVASPAPVAPTETTDPFKKGGLRRSNVAPPAPANNTPAEDAPTEETPTENTRTERAATEETLLNTQSTAPLNPPVQEPVPEPQPQPQPEPQAELEPEPELPPTPTQLGIPDPVVTAEPTGIHNTPSKRPKRPRSTTLKSSPLKPRDPPPTQPVPATVTATASASKSAPPPSAFPLKPKTKPTTTTTTTTTTTSEPPSKRRKPSPPPSRNLLPPDPHAAKKRRRAALLAEVAQLEADLSLAEAENARIRRHHEAGRRDVPAPKNEDAILDLLLRAARPRAPLAEEGPRKKSVMMSVGAFLPFAKKRRAVVSKEVVKQGELPSYGPVEVEDPMAYLSVFSPLGFTSTTTILASVGESGAVLQRRDVVAKAPGGLFHARVGVVVDTASLAVVGVDVDGLDGNAEPEIGRWMRERAGEGVLGRDVNAVFYGMGQWVEGAAKRARFWCQIGEEFRGGGGKGKEKRRKGKGREGEEELDEAVGAGKWTAKDLLPHMRRTALVLPVEDVEVTVEWRIALDWTGEAEHVISASARVPRSWHEQDERRSLTRVPEMFRKLVESRGPVVAVRTVVAGLLG